MVCILKLKLYSILQNSNSNKFFNSYKNMTWHVQQKTKPKFSYGKNIAIN